MLDGISIKTNELKKYIFLIRKFGDSFKGTNFPFNIV